MKYVKERKKKSTPKNIEHRRVGVAMKRLRWRIIRQNTLCKRVQ